MAPDHGGHLAASSRGAPFSGRCLMKRSHADQFRQGQTDFLPTYLCRARPTHFDRRLRSWNLSSYIEDWPRRSGAPCCRTADDRLRRRARARSFGRNVNDCSLLWETPRPWRSVRRRSFLSRCRNTRNFRPSASRSRGVIAGKRSRTIRSSTTTLHLNR